MYSYCQQEDTENENQKKIKVFILVLLVGMAAILIFSKINHAKLEKVEREIQWEKIQSIA